MAKRRTPFAAVLLWASLLSAAGISEPTLVPGQIIAAWDFTKATDELAPNAVPGMPDLKAGRETPGVVKDGMQFNNGGCLQCPGVPGLLDGKTPFELSLRIRPLQLPGGYCGGLFQCFEYNKAGFRLCLLGHMRLTCDIYPPGGKLVQLRGQTVLELGRTYDVRVLFAPEYAYLYLDGKLDAAVKSGLPAATKADILVGDSAGRDYYYNGVIGYITIKQLN
jgi:hypothetical protein